MRLEQLEYLIAIEKYGSLSKSAEQLFMTHSALSIAITKLEKELGYLIFERTSKGLIPTPYGKQVIERAKKIYAEIDYIKNGVFVDPSIRISLHIATIATISNNILLEIIIAFKQSFPDYNLIVDEVYPNEVPEMIIERKARIGISFFEKSKEEKFLKLVQENHLCWEPLYQDYLCAYVAKDNPLLYKPVVYEQDVKAYLPVSINHRQTMETKDYYNNFIDNEFVLSFTNQESIKKMIAENNAVAYLPKILAYGDFYVKSGAIVPLEIVDSCQEIIHYTLYPKNVSLSQAETAFIDGVKRMYSKLKKEPKLSE